MDRINGPTAVQDIKFEWLIYEIVVTNDVVHAPLQNLRNKTSQGANLSTIINFEPTIDYVADFNSTVALRISPNQFLEPASIHLGIRARPIFVRWTQMCSSAALRSLQLTLRDRETLHGFSGLMHDTPRERDGNDLRSQDCICRLLGCPSAWPVVIGKVSLSTLHMRAANRWQGSEPRF